MVVDHHQFVPPSAPPADICPSSPPPSYPSSPGTTATQSLTSCENAKNARKVSDDVDNSSDPPTDAVVVVPVPKDKVAILCLGHHHNRCGRCVSRPLRLIGCHHHSDSFAIIQPVSGRNSRSKMRQLLAFGCCAFSIIIFGFFAFAVGFIVLAFVDSQHTQNDEAFEQYQMRLFGHHFG